MVRHVGQLVGEHGPELPFVADLEDALRRAHRGVVLVAPGGERVGLHHLRHVDARHRQASGRRELADDPVQLRLFLLGDRLGPRRGHGDPVGEPVHREVEDQRDDQRDDHAARAPDRADGHEQAAQRRDQDPGLDPVQALHRSVTPPRRDVARPRRPSIPSGPHKSSLRVRCAYDQRFSGGPPDLPGSSR